MMVRKPRKNPGQGGQKRGLVLGPPCTKEDRGRQRKPEKNGMQKKKRKASEGEKSKKSGKKRGFRGKKGQKTSGNPQGKPVTEGKDPPKKTSV